MVRGGVSAVDLTGAILDRRYRLTGLLGKGGMGDVYDAVHVALEQRVAVKVLLPRYAHESRFRERFLQEARAASKIRHANVVEIKDFGGTPDGSVYFVMEYLQGHDLSAELLAHGAIPWARTRGILLQAASALHAAHQCHIIHRDIKPGNCFLTPGGEAGLDVVKLLDFGIAKVSSDSHDDAQGRGLTGSGEVFGTVRYMSPEQARGGTLDARSDLYSLGIMAYELLTGQVPFSGANPIHVITQHLSDPPVPPRNLEPSIPAEVEALVLRMIAKAPCDRFESMATLERALRAIPESAGMRRTKLWSSPGHLRAVVAEPEPTAVVMPVTLRGGGQRIDQPTVVNGELQAVCATAPVVVSTMVTSTSPHGVAGDTGSETRPCSLDEPAARGISTSLLLVASVLVILVGGVSALATMSLLTTRGVAQEKPEDVAEQELEVAAIEPLVDGAPMRALERERSTGASGEESRPVEEGRDGAKVVEGPGALATDEGGRGAPEPSARLSLSAGAQPRRASPRAAPAYETERCAQARALAGTTLRRRLWSQAAGHARQSQCWAPSEQGARQALLVKALLELGQFDKCIEAGRKAREPATVDDVEKCRRLAK
jgi:tRNA A-37 threonylcarbamoyl transferase component Bud32